jgi:hypothetical protein
MKPTFGLAILGVVLALPVLIPTDDGLSGNWQLTTMAPMGDKATTSLLIKFEITDGKTAATLVGSANKGKAELLGFSIAGDRVRFVVKASTEQVFEGLLSKDGKKIAGILGNDESATAAYMVPTNATSIPAKATAVKLSLTPEELSNWADCVTTVAKDHATQQWPARITSQFALAYLAKRDDDRALQYAKAAEAQLNANTPRDVRVKVLQAMSRILSDAGKNDDLKKIAARLDEEERIFDKDYAASLPAFKVEKFAGRKPSSDRVVVMELFTGAQCPDCPPADVAFDALQKTYTPGELVLLEYHTHIPGPDPMTNPDTEARWKYYRDAHGKGVPGVPTSLFNGTPKGGYGGRLPDSEKYYKTYCGIVDPLLETPASCKITASAKRVGDKIHIDAAVTGLKDAGKDKKIRLALVEESIRFVGANKIRFHHQVVRAFPGGAAGFAAMNPTASVQADLDVFDLRKKLISYLDNYAATQRPFAQVSRPLDLEHLRVIAFVQDDTTHEILQATQVDVTR